MFAIDAPYAFFSLSFHMELFFILVSLITSYLDLPQSVSLDVKRRLKFLHCFSQFLRSSFFVFRNKYGVSDCEAIIDLFK